MALHEKKFPFYEKCTTSNFGQPGKLDLNGLLYQKQKIAIKMTKKTVKRNKKTLSNDQHK